MFHSPSPNPTLSSLTPSSSSPSSQSHSLLPHPSSSSPSSQSHSLLPHPSSSSPSSQSHSLLPHPSSSSPSSQSHSLLPHPSSSSPSSQSHSLLPHPLPSLTPSPPSPSSQSHLSSQEHELLSLKADLAAVQFQLTVKTTENNELEEEGRALQTLLIEKEVLIFSCPYKNVSCTVLIECALYTCIYIPSAICMVAYFRRSSSLITRECVRSWRPNFMSARNTQMPSLTR